jgi:CubicO group peptidase (beta-lactamase class C family)
MPALRIDPARLQPAFDALETRVRSGRATAGVLGVAIGEEVVRVQAYGSDADGGPATAGTRFFIASITKPIVATAVVQLAAEGRITLAEPLRTYMADLPESLGIVSARHILTHTSGIPDDTFGEWASRDSREEIVRRAAGRPLDFAPGSRYAYCSTSFYLLGELLSRMDRVPFEHSLRRRILDPLGMRATSFHAFDPAGSWVPPVGLPGGDLAPEEMPELIGYLASISQPGGGLWSTAGDLLRFARAYLRGGRLDGVELLPAAWVELMGREQTADVREASPDGWLPERDPHYALGWGKPAGGGDLPCSDRAMEHGGISGTRLLIDPIRDLAVVVLANHWDVSETSTAVISAAHSALVAR